jgi:DNA polymerase-1
LIENVENNKEKALLSKRLATIDINVPIEFDEAALIIEKADKEKTEKLFVELEFKTLLKRLFPDSTAAPESSASKQQQASSGAFDLFNQGSIESKSIPAVNTSIENIETEEEESVPKNTIANTEHQYKIASTEEEINELVDLLLQQKEICFDTETSQLESTEASIVGLSFSWKEHEGYYIPFPNDDAEAKSILEKFRTVFENESITKIGQNIKYDLK